MSLRGSLPDFNVVDVLNLVGYVGKTGVVRFSREHGALTQNGAIYFRDGRPVAAEADGLEGEEALEVLCSWESGGFVYREGATSPRENLDRPAPALLERAIAALEEWREIRRLLPEPSRTVRMVSDLPHQRDEVRLSRDEWGMLARMSRLESVSAWAQQLGGGLDAYRVLRRLVENGLIRVESRESRVESAGS